MHYLMPIYDVADALIYVLLYDVEEEVSRSQAGEMPPCGARAAKEARQREYSAHLLSLLSLSSLLPLCHIIAVIIIIVVNIEFHVSPPIFGEVLGFHTSSHTPFLPLKNITNYYFIGTLIEGHHFHRHVTPLSRHCHFYAELPRETRCMRHRWPCSFTGYEPRFTSFTLNVYATYAFIALLRH